MPVLSWLALGGRCRYCRRPISIQYPIIELVLAAGFVFSYLWWPVALDNGQKLLLVTWLVSSVGLLALAVYDYRWMMLPNRLIYPTLAIAISGRIGYILLFADNKPRQLLIWLGSVVVTSGLFWLLFVISRGKWIGYGDVRLGLITGTILADPVLGLAMIFFASLAGSLAALPHLAKGKKNISAKMPYGPFLIFATWFVLLFGDQVVGWYKDLIL